MQHVSRKLLLAGVLAFGTLTAACGDKLTITQVAPFVGVQSVSVSPQNATVNVGSTITLAASVTADATTAKTVSWTTSDATVATVDQAGKVTGVKAGTVTVIATATADVSKTAGAAIVVQGVPGPIVPNPTIAINSVTDVNGNPVNLSNTTGQVNVSINTSGGGLIETFLSTSCTTNTISSTDVAVASQTASSAQAGTVTLSFNTAALNAAGTAPRFANGNYCVKARLTNGTSVVVATNTQPITLNNVNQFKATLAFTSVTGGPTSAVSTTNGLNYNQGTLTVTLNPVIFTSTTQPTLISGYLTRNGEQASAGVPVGAATFTNATVSSGSASIVFTDTAVVGVRSIFRYNSLPAGDTLYITSATDAAGNPIAVAGPFVVSSGLRIDNDIPVLAAAYSVNAPNGYIGGQYAFSSGTTTPGATDTHVAVAGVGGVTTTYYVGAAGSAAFTTANSCDVTGLTAATNGSGLANTTATNADQAKVVVTDALGNKNCVDVASTFAGGLFGVDKIAPNLAFASSTTAQTSGTNASASTGYNVTGKLFAFTFIDTISGFNPATPIVAKVVRNFYATPSAADCVLGTYNVTTKDCATVGSAGSFDITGNPITNVAGYYTVTAAAVDQAGNASAVLTRDAAFDPTAPTIGAITQSPAAVAPLGTVTVSATAADNLNLTTSRGQLSYATSPNPFARVTGNVLGTFGQMITSATATVALPNVYRGLQSTDASGVILANTAVPMATITVTDVGRTTATSAAATIATTTAAANIQTGNNFQITSSATTPANVATTSLTAKVVGSSTDPAFQSQPFTQIDFYQVNSTTAGSTTNLFLVGTNTLASVTDNGSGVRTYTYTNSGVALTQAGSTAAGGSAATNTFFAVGRNAAGDAVITATAAVQTQPVLP
ncbi:hypothetical protein BH11GEM1_BH11GEM1_11950 [soil metagenome]